MIRKYLILVFSLFVLGKFYFEANRNKEVLNQVLSKEIADEVLKRKTEGEEREIAILFADIRNFSQLTQKMGAREIADLLNEIMKKIIPVVSQYHGVIDKYLGDGMMVLFGAPISDEKAALNAVLAACEMQRILAQYNRGRDDPIFFGMAIHAGSVFMGNVGTRERFNYTAIGANVNLAAHLCSAASPSQILITEAVLQSVKEMVEVEKLPSIYLKGFEKPIEIFSPLLALQ